VLSERPVQLLGWLQVQSLRTVAVLVSNPSLWLLLYKLKSSQVDSMGGAHEDDSKWKETAFIS